MIAITYFRPDTTFAYYTGLGSDYEAGAVLVLNPVDPDSPSRRRQDAHSGTVREAARRQIHRGTSSCPPTTANTGLGPRAGLKEMQAMTGIETHDIAPAGRRPVQGRGCRSRRHYACAWSAKPTRKSTSDG